MTTRLSFVATCVLAVAVLALATSPARGGAWENFTWDGDVDNLWDSTSGNNTNWNHEGNNDPIPTFNDNVFFGGAAPYTTVELNGNRSVLSVDFSGNENYTLSESTSLDTLTLVEGNINARGGGTFAISAKIALEADGVWDTALRATRLSAYGVLDGSAYQLTKTGIGWLTLSGGDAVTPSKLWSLRADDGDVVLDGAHLTLTGADTAMAFVLRAQTGNITLQNGAVLQMGTFGAGYVEDGTLTITGSGSSLYGRQLDAGELGTTGNIVVEDGALLDTSKYLWVGISSDGDLKVRSGATATTSHFALGVKTTTSGTALVTGTNSLLSSTDLDLGGSSDTSLGGTGALTVQDGGAVQVAHETTFWTGASSITIDGGTLETDQLTNDTGVTATVSITDPTGGVALTVGTNDGSSTFDGLIQDATGAGSLTKVGSGTLTLTGANTYTRWTIIVGGSIIVGHANALGDSTVYINVNDGLDVTTNSIDATIGALAGAANLNLGSQKLITGVNGADTTYSGTISGTSDSFLKHDGAGTLTLTGTGSNFGFLYSNNSSGTVVLDGFDATLTGASGPNALRARLGALTVSNGSTIITTSTDVTAMTGGTLTVTGSGTQVTSGRYLWAIFGGECIVEDLADVTASAAYIGAFQASAGSGTLTVDSGGSVDISGSTVLGLLSGDVGDVTVTGAGSSLSTNSLKLGGSNSSNLGGTGTLTVEDGATVHVTNGTKLWTSASSITIDGGTFETKTLTNHTDVVATVSISDPTGQMALTVGGSSGSSTFDGLIQDAVGGAGSLKKSGTGTFTLTGANTYTGGTILEDGTLLASNTTGSATGTGWVQVNSGGTLGGTGSVAGSVTVASGGTLAMGASPGTLSLGGGLAFESGSILAIEIAGLIQGDDYDFLDVAGDVTLNGSLGVSLLNPFSLGDYQQFDILNVVGNLAGTFTGLGEGGLVDNFGGTDLFITYSAGSGNDIALYTVPEPATLLVMTAAGLPLLLKRRRNA